MIKIARIIFVFAVSSFLMGFAWKTANKVKEANRLFDENKYADALAGYNDAQIDAPNSAEIYFNMGDVFYRQKKYSEAIDSYRKAIEKGGINLEAKVYYNIGNSLFRQGRLKEALDSYKQALELNPDDVDTKFNIEFTQRRIKEMLSRSQETMQKAVSEESKREKQGQVQSGQGAEKKENTHAPKSSAAAQAQKTKGQKQSGEKKQAAFTPEREGQEASEVKRRGNGKGSAPAKELTRKDAERILTTLEAKEKRSSLLDKIQASRQGYEYGVEKDW